MITLVNKTVFTNAAPGESAGTFSLSTPSTPGNWLVIIEVIGGSRLPGTCSMVTNDGGGNATYLTSYVGFPVNFFGNLLGISFIVAPDSGFNSGGFLCSSSDSIGNMTVANSVAVTTACTGSAKPNSTSMSAVKQYAYVTDQSENFTYQKSGSNGTSYAGVQVLHTTKACTTISFSQVTAAKPLYPSIIVYELSGTSIVVSQTAESSSAGPPVSSFSPPAVTGLSGGPQQATYSISPADICVGVAIALSDSSDNTVFVASACSTFNNIASNGGSGNVTGVSTGWTADIISMTPFLGYAVGGASAYLTPPIEGNVLWQHGTNFSGFQPSNSALLPFFYCRYGGILKDESNCWTSAQGPNAGTNLGLNAVRNYCMANDIWMSGFKDSQDSAAKLLTDLCEIANCAAAWDGTGLDFIPYSEASAYGNGTLFTPYTAAGPIFELDRSDFIPKEKNGPPITKTQQRPDQNYNSIKVDFLDAFIQYESNEVILSDTGDITAQGILPGNAKNYTLVNSDKVAAKVGWVQLKRAIIVGREQYSFRLHRYWSCIFTPMDFVLLVDNPQPILGPPISPWMMPARIVKLTENLQDEALDVECEPYVYGASAPTNVPQGTITHVEAQQKLTNYVLNNVNTPIIIEATPSMAPTGPELWLCVSNASSLASGCYPYVSTDGGNTYTQLSGKISGNCIMGAIYSSDYPNSTDPDSTDTLNVDLTESLGSLSSFSRSQQNLFVSLCYLAGGGTISGLTIPYELTAYGTANLSSPDKYALPPSIRRGVQGTPTADHPVGTPFAYLGPGSAIYRFSLPQTLIGVQLYFKFVAFGAGVVQNISTCTAYSFTPSGLVGWSFTALGSLQPPSVPVPSPLPSPPVATGPIYEDYWLPSVTTSIPTQRFQNSSWLYAEDVPTLVAGQVDEDYWLPNFVRMGIPVPIQFLSSWTYAEEIPTLNAGIPFEDYPINPVTTTVAPNLGSSFDSGGLL